MEAELQNQNRFQFLFDKDLLIPIDEIYQKSTGTFDVSACVRWSREKALIQTSGGNSVNVREGVLYDTAGQIILSVWGDMIDTIKEDHLHCFTQVPLRNYFGRKLTKLKISVAAVQKSSQDFPTLEEAVFKCYLDQDQEIKKMVNPKLCCPEFLNIELDVFPGCTNKQSNKRLNLLPGAKIVTYHHCSRTMRADNHAVYFTA